MRRNIVGILAAAAALGWAMPALAQEEAPTCSAEAPPLPPEMAGWAQRPALNAAMAASGLRSARLAIGKGVDAVLAPTPKVRYALRPEKPGGSVSYGGLYSFTVDRAGTYRVALGSAAWIDLVKAGGKAGSATGIVSIAHGHGPACSGIRKMVDFALEPATYLLQISANAEQRLPLLVTRVP